MKIKTTYSAVLMMSVVALIVTSMPVYASEMDDRIELSARKSHVFKTYLGGDDIKIQSKDGDVTLTGTVSEESHKALAYETVAGLPGVKSVDNRLELKGTPPAEYSDEWLGAKVKATLSFHQSVNASKTEVDVKDGIVTLRGEAATQARKELATEYAKDVEGVKDVNNEMTVSIMPSATVPQRQLWAKISMTLPPPPRSRYRCCTIARPAPSTPRSRRTKVWSRYMARQRTQPKRTWPPNSPMT